MSLMNIFQNPLSEIPPYASNIKLLLFESQTGDYIVNITYNGNKVKIPSCEKEDCTLSEFIAAIEDKISLGCEGQGGRENCGESPMPNGVKLEY